MNGCMHAFVAASVNPMHTNARRDASMHMSIHMPIHRSLNMPVHMFVHMFMHIPLLLHIYKSGVRFDTLSHTTRALANDFIYLHAYI